MVADLRRQRLGERSLNVALAWTASARALAEYFADTHFTAIYILDLKRLNCPSSI